MIVEGIVSFFQTYNLALAFIAGLAVGDLMIVLGMVVSAGKANFLYVIIAALIGGILHDAGMYLVANAKFAHYIKKRFKLSRRKNGVAKFIEKIGNGHYFVPVLLAKFIYGVRDAVIIYVAHNHKDFKKFIFTVAIADLIWLLTITSVGWLAGRGFDFILYAFKGFERFLFLIGVAIIAIYIFNKVTSFFIIKFAKKKVNKRTKKSI